MTVVKLMSLSLVVQVSLSSNPDDGRPFADMTYDTVFKNVFNDREVLLGFLNAVKAAGEGVTIKEINRVERPGVSDVRGVIYDIRCTLSNNASVIVELQRALQRSEIIDRMLGYVSTEYSTQWQRDEPFSYMLTPVHAVAIMGFTFDRDREKCGSMLQVYSEICVYGEGAELAVSRSGELTRRIYVQLPLAPDKIDDNSREDELWAYLLRQSSTLKEVPSVLAKGAFKR